MRFGDGNRAGLALAILTLASAALYRDSRFFLRASAQTVAAPAASAASTTTYLGFDRNEYPGDTAMAALRSTFSYTGYWLNNPPGARTNTWTGKRSWLADRGFGFLVLFNGRLDAELKRVDAAQSGRTDGAAAVAAAKKEGFPPATVIFLDIEEGGRMLAEQKAYIYAWVDAVNAAGFRAGVYCSGIPAPEGGRVTVITAEDLRQNAGGRSLQFWVANDACPPSPGCVLPQRALAPAASGVASAVVWQYAQSPRRAEVARACKRTYAADGNCYVPAARTVFLDLNTAHEADPSHGRTPRDSRSGETH